MNGGLDEYPKQLLGRELMPWEEGYERIVTVPFPNLRCFGKTLVSLTSPQLLAVRRECERRNGDRGVYFVPLMEKIDEILTERGGE